MIVVVALEFGSVGGEGVNAAALHTSLEVPGITAKNEKLPLKICIHLDNTDIIVLHIIVLYLMQICLVYIFVPN